LLVDLRLFTAMQSANRPPVEGAFKLLKMRETVLIDLKYYFTAVQLVNRQPMSNRAAFFDGVYHLKMQTAPNGQIRRMMEQYRERATRRPAGSWVLTS
jgi:hypothetical protein